MYESLFYCLLIYKGCHRSSRQAVWGYRSPGIEYRLHGRSRERRGGPAPCGLYYSMGNVLRVADATREGERYEGTARRMTSTNLNSEAASVGVDLCLTVAIYYKVFSRGGQVF